MLGMPWRIVRCRHGTIGAGGSKNGDIQLGLRTEESTGGQSLMRMRLKASISGHHPIFCVIHVLCVVHHQSLPNCRLSDSYASTLVDQLQLLHVMSACLPVIQSEGGLPGLRSCVGWARFHYLLLARFRLDVHFSERIPGRQVLSPHSLLHWSNLGILWTPKGVYADLRIWIE